MKQIEGLENMTCSQIMDTMNEIMEQAEARAASLSEEIQRSYEERDTVGAKAHEAAEGKNLKAYKDARLHYDMLTEWIAKAEAVEKRSREPSGSLRSLRACPPVADVFPILCRITTTCSRTNNAHDGITTTNDSNKERTM